MSMLMYLQSIKTLCYVEFRILDLRFFSFFFAIFDVFSQFFNFQSIKALC